jgi:hypothetical protein
VTIQDNYQTDGSASLITLAIQLSGATISRIHLTINGSCLACPAANSQNEMTIPLDTNINLKGKLLQMACSIRVPGASAAVSIAVEIDGGAGPHRYALRRIVGVTNASPADLRTVITFL